jgi:heat shock protein HslJ
MGKRMLVLMVGLVAAVVFQGCVTTPTPGGSSALDGTAWRLSMLPGQDELRDRSLTMSFEQGRVSGSDGCNNYSAAYMATERELLVGSAMAETRMSCASAVMKQATAFKQALTAARTYRIDTRRLVLVDDRGRDVAVFSPERGSRDDRPSRDRLRCGNREIVVEYLQDALVLTIGRETFIMHPVKAASGAKYVADNDPATTFWSKGDRALLVWKGQALPECSLSSDGRQPRGRGTGRD